VLLIASKRANNMSKVEAQSVYDMTDFTLGRVKDAYSKIKITMTKTIIETNLTKTD
jgi:hypothetical protein